MKNNYKINGDEIVIYLRRKDGTILETVIDKNDFDIANRFPNTWFSRYSNFTDSYYVTGNIAKEDGKHTIVYLHRWLFNNPDSEIFIDHINHDTLDNRRSVNLKESNCSDNQLNRNKPNKNNSTGYKNIYWSKQRQKYNVLVTIDKKLKNLGFFNTLNEAIVYLEGFKKQNKHKSISR